MNRKQILIDVKAYIEKGWTQGAYARTSAEITPDNVVLAWDEKAVCWCLAGALKADHINIFMFDHEFQLLIKDIKDLPFNSFNTMIEWNDQPERTKEEVLAVLDHMIASI